MWRGTSGHRVREEQVSSCSIVLIVCILVVIRLIASVIGYSFNQYKLFLCY